MSRKPQKHFKRWLTRKFFIFSTLVILVTISIIFGSWLLIRGRDPYHVKVDSTWLDDNIWRVQSYKEVGKDKYDVYLLRVEPALNPDFEDLVYVFNNTKYTSFNSYYLRDGVNCQGMVCYLASWCEKFGYEYSVAWNQTHTLIYIRYNSKWYKFDFNSSNASIEEVIPKYVKKGMVLQ